MGPSERGFEQRIHRINIERRFCPRALAVPILLRPRTRIMLIDVSDSEL